MIQSHRRTAASRRAAAGAAIAAALALWAIPAGAQSPSSPRVLVLPFSAQAEAQAPGGAGTALWLREATAVLLADNLESLGVGAFSRDQRVAAFDRLQLPRAASFSRATMIRVGELVGASEIVFGDVHLGPKLSVRAHVVDLQTSRQLPDVVDEGELSDLFALLERVAGRIGQALGRRVIATPRPPVRLPLEAFENYMKGLVAATPAAQQRFLETAMTQVPHDGRVLTALWSVYTEQGSHEKALAAASAVPADSPLARRARFDVALSLIELKRLDGAWKELTALYAQARGAAVSNALGIVQLRRGPVTDTPAAPSYFERAITEDPNNTDYRFNLGYARALAGETAVALTALREAVRRDAADGDAHLVMSVLLSASGRTPEAHRELDLARLLGTSLETAPSTPPTKVPPGLERLQTDLDTTSPVEAALTDPAQRDQREAALFHLDQARRLVNQQRDREAVNELRRAIYLMPYEDEPHLLMGRLHQRGGRLSDAIDEFKVAIWCRETAAARVALGTAMLEAGDKAGARREAERAVALNPTMVEARELLKKTGGE